MNNVVLIVDDSGTMRSLVAVPLRAAGYEVVEAVNGFDGLARTRAQPPAVIICDVNMPGMNGIEMVEQLRAAGRQVPVVMLTTETQPELIVRAKKAGATGWMVKPFNPERLVATIKHVCERAQLPAPTLDKEASP